MGFKDLGKGFKKLGKSKVTKEVTEDTLESLNKKLLERSSKIIDSMGNQWEKDAIDTAGALSHLPEVKPMPKGALRNKGEKVFDLSPLKVVQFENIDDGFNVFGNSNIFDIEGVIKSKNKADNYLHAEVSGGSIGQRYNLLGESVRDGMYNGLSSAADFKSIAQEAMDNGEQLPYWARKRANNKDIKPKQEIKNRRKGNREIKETPVNNPIQQEQQLLLEAPKQREPRKPRREYKPDLGTNTDPIELPGPPRNRRRGNRATREVPVQQEQQLLLNAPKQKEPRKTRREYKSDLGTNTEPIELSGPVQSSPADNKRLDNIERVEEAYRNGALTEEEYLQKYKALDSTHKKEKMAEQKQKYPLDDITEDITNPSPNKPTSPVYDSQQKKLKELLDNGQITQEQYNSSVANLDERFNSTPSADDTLKEKLEDINKKMDTELQNELDNIGEKTPEKSLPPEQKIEMPQKQKVEVNLDDFKTKTEIDNMDIEDNNFEVKEEPEVSPTPNSKQDQNVFSELTKRDSDLLYTAKTDAYELNLRNSLPDSIKYGDKNYQFMYDKNGAFNLFDAEGNILAHDTEEFGNIYNAIATEREKYLYNLSNEEWDIVAKRPERFGFDQYGRNINGDDARLYNKIDVYNKRKEVLSKQISDTQTELNDVPGKEKDKIEELKNKRNELSKQNYEIDRKKFKAESKYQAREDRRKVREQFQQKVKEEGLEKGSEAYQQAEKELKEKFESINVGRKKSIERQNNRIDAKTKGLEGKGFSVGKAINIGFTAKAAVDKYKESKAEGKSTASSIMRAAGSAAVAEVLGPAAQIGLDIAKAVPKVAISGADALYKEYRRMNSVANLTPLGGVNYQDSQELATMRQSGMELAKMSQYNLEQTLMGAEAKHLHR